MKPNNMARSRARRIATAIGVAGLAIVIAVPAVSAASPKTKRVSVTSGGAQASGGGSDSATSSHTGRYVAFDTSATNLAPGDVVGRDVYRRDIKGPRTVWLSYPKSGPGNDGSSWDPSISSSGRFVAFVSSASTLIASDTNGIDDIFIQDLRTRKNKRVSVNSREKQTIGGNSNRPSISGSGRYVAFESDATNLVKNDTNGKRDIFVRDRKAGKTTRVNVRSNGKQAVGGDSAFAAISANGRYVAFDSEATNLVKNDTNNKRDIFIHDRATGKTRRVSVKSNGRQVGEWSLEPAVSADGRYVAFESIASNLVKNDTNNKRDIFIHDRATGKTRRVSKRSDGKQALGGDSGGASISANGRYVAFGSDATNLYRQDTNGTTDVFVHDRKSGKTRVQSRDTAGAASNSWSFRPDISGDGRFVAFTSRASDLVAGDTNGEQDIFRRGPLR